jgi:uncharacterized membrane protein
MHQRPRVDPAVVIGWLLAICVHPLTAWRVLSMSDRLFVVAAYFVFSFITTLVGLLALAPAFTL